MYITALALGLGLKAKRFGLGLGHGAQGPDLEFCSLHCYNYWATYDV